MKRLILTAIIALNIISIPIGVCAQEVRSEECEIIEVHMDDYSNDYTQIFDILKKAINSVKSTGNPDLDYLKLVDAIQAAINQLSQAVTKYSTNPQLIKASNDVREEYEGQFREIAILYEQLAKENKNTPSNSDYFKEYKAVTDKLLKELEGYKLVDNTELNYLRQLYILDKAMVNLSEVSKPYLKDETTKKIADNIIRLAGDQIKRINDLIKEIAK